VNDRRNRGGRGERARVADRPSLRTSAWWAQEESVPDRTIDDDPRLKKLW